MTQSELKNKIHRLQCCSGNMAKLIVDNITLGDKSCKVNINNLLLLNDYIDLLLKYDLSENAINCIDSNEFDIIYSNAIVLCKICDCQ